jgi:membrane-associated protein
MHYATFSFFNVIGGVLWVTTMMFAGYFFGGLPLIKNNFETAVIVIIVISLIPAVLEFLKHRKESRAQKGTAAQMNEEIKKTFDQEDLNK